MYIQEESHVNMKTANSKQRREARNRFSLMTLRRNQFYQHLNVGLLASETVIEQVSIV